MKNLYSRILALIIFIYFPIIGIFAQGSEVPGIISYSKTDTITSTTFSVVWPVSFPDNDYFLYIRAWTEEIVNGSTVQITNGIYNFSQTESGFSLNVKNAGGYLTYLAIDNSGTTEGGAIAWSDTVDFIATKADLSNFWSKQEITDSDTLKWQEGGSKWEESENGIHYDGGKVGIGGAPLRYQFEVNPVTDQWGNFIYYGDGSEGLLFQKSTDLFGLIGYDNSDYNDIEIRAKSGRGSQLYLDTSGSVGIGTNNPKGKFEISNSFIFGYDPTDSNYSNIWAGGVPTLSGTNYNLQLKNDGSEMWFNVPAAGNYQFLVNNAWSATALRIQHDSRVGIGYSVLETIPNLFSVKGAASFNGNVGIGNTSPSEKLEVNGNAIADNATLDTHLTPLGQVKQVISDSINAISETDPVYSTSEASNIDASDITNLSNISGINTGDQTISTTGSAGNITISGGNTLNLNINDADASSTNELQSLSFSYPNLSISGGNSVDLSTIQNDSVNYSVQNILESNPIWDADFGINANYTLTQNDTITMQNLPIGRSGTLVVSCTADGSKILYFEGYTFRIAQGVRYRTNAVYATADSYSVYSWYYNGVFVVIAGTLRVY